MIRFFTSCYPERNPQRLAELSQCLERNLASPAVDEVCVFLEGMEAAWVNSSRLNCQHVIQRPTYAEFFRWANERVTSNEDLSIVANSDICFDMSVSVLSERLKPNQCVALSRWDVQQNGSARLFDRNDSQDAWIFRGRIRPVVADFCVGIPRCDNRILYELRAAGYEVINPAFSVKVFHLHAGEREEYPGQIDGMNVEPPYGYLWPHNLMSLPATMLHRLRNPGVPLGWRFDWRKLQRSLSYRALRKLQKLATGN
ncbi:MAG TPA: hypothetical protein PK992_02135 [Planctomycetaceae bacterium]|nr:hypothetical protein [Planctomycetaceae bacterium]HRA86830.1 hypothetical protein [Planctomycetaceae bacterium]